MCENLTEGQKISIKFFSYKVDCRDDLAIKSSTVLMILIVKIVFLFCLLNFSTIFIATSDLSASLLIHDYTWLLTNISSHRSTSNKRKTSQQKDTIPKRENQQVQYKFNFFSVKVLE